MERMRMNISVPLGNASADGTSNAPLEPVDTNVSHSVE